MSRYRRDVDNSQDILDARDIASRISDLEDELQAEYDEKYGDDAEREDPVNPPPHFDVWVKELSSADLTYSEEAKELLMLRELYEEIGGDATLIRESYFEDYAQQLAEDIGAIDRNLGWPACHTRNRTAPARTARGA